MFPRQHRSPYSTRPSRLDILDKAIRKFRDDFYDWFAYFFEFGGGCIAAEDDASETRELNRGVEGPREFFVNKGFYPSA
jgi:hypothetical protein